MDTKLVLYLMLCFTIKHFIADYILQTPYHLKHKGTYGHPGGLWHSGIHGLGTVLAVLPFYKMLGVKTLLIVVAADTVIHYHIDYFKMKLNDWWHATPDTNQYWWLFGLDQTLHFLTYLALIGYMAL